jgi:hypothetical protein
LVALAFEGNGPRHERRLRQDPDWNAARVDEDHRRLTGLEVHQRDPGGSNVALEDLVEAIDIAARVALSQPASRVHVGRPAVANDAIMEVGELGVLVAEDRVLADQRPARNLVLLRAFEPEGGRREYQGRQKRKKRGQRQEAQPSGNGRRSAHARRQA